MVSTAFSGSSPLDFLPLPFWHDDSEIIPMIMSPAAGPATLKARIFAAYPEGYVLWGLSGQSRGGL